MINLAIFTSSLSHAMEPLNLWSSDGDNEQPSIFSYPLYRFETRKKCPSMYETLTLLKELPGDITNEAFLIPQVLQIDISEEAMAKEHRKQLDKRNKNRN